MAVLCNAVPLDDEKNSFSVYQSKKKDFQELLRKFVRDFLPCREIYLLLFLAVHYKDEEDTMVQKLIVCSITDGIIISSVVL